MQRIVESAAHESLMSPADSPYESRGWSARIASTFGFCSVSTTVVGAGMRNSFCKRRDVLSLGGVLELRAVTNTTVSPRHRCQVMSVSAIALGRLHRASRLSFT